MKKYLQYSSFIASLAVFGIGHVIDRYNIILVGVLLMLLSNLIYGFASAKKRVFFLVFNFTFFVFLLGRPTVSMFRGNEWWYFESSAVHFALNACFLSLMALQIGTAMFERLHRPIKRPPSNPRWEESKNESVQVVSLCLFYLAMFFYLVMELEKLLFMRGREYTDFYIAFASQMPFLIRFLSGLMKPALCIFLSTLPKKSRTVFPLVLYVLSAVPMLIIGARNPIVLNLLFALLYYYIRDVLQKYPREKWIGRFEKTAIVLAIPAAIIFLAMYNFIRADVQVERMGLFSALVELIYRQGVSFDVLCMAFLALPNLPNVVPKCYTFGGFIDEFQHGTIAQALFGATPLGESNSVYKAVYGNSFAHSMSYVAKDTYLEGEGWGSSYILETYADFGYVGMFLFGILLGVALGYLVYLIYQGGFRSVLGWMAATTLFLVPRDSATGWIEFIITPRFWVAVVFCYIVGSLCAKSYRQLPHMQAEYLTNRRKDTRCLRDSA